MRLFYLSLLLLTFSTVSAKPLVITTIKPLHSIAANVMSGITEPVLLMDKNLSAHHYTLTPKNRLQLEQANLIVWTGDAIETPLVQLLNNTSLRDKVYSVLSTQQLELHIWRSIDNKHEHEHHQHKHKTDQHIWLNTDNAAKIAIALATRLSEIDPANKQHYLDNSAQFTHKLKLLKTHINKQLSPVTKRPFMVSHDAYQYFDQQFGLNYQGNLTINPRLPLSGRHWLKLQRELQQKQPVCLFYDPAYHPRLAMQIRDQTHIRLQALDPVGYVLTNGPQLYFELLVQISQGIFDCLQHRSKSLTTIVHR